MLVSKKNLLLKSLLGFYVLATLAACNLPAPREKDDTLGNEKSSATFSIQAMADKSKALEAQVQGSFALPSSKIFNFQACLKDVAYNKVIVGHDFLVEEAQTTTTSDKSGCISWSEKINYNFLAESQYIRITRHVKGLGLHKGRRAISFAINPWSHGENISAILNPDDGNRVPRLIDDATLGEKALKGFSADQTLIARPLWVEDGRLFINEQKLDKDGVSLLVEMRPNPSIQMTKLNGETFLRPLVAGQFKAQTKIIHIYQQNGKEIHRLLGENLPQDVKMENGSLAIKSTILLPALPTRGQVMLGLTLTPMNGPQGLKSFEGVYLVGEYDQIKGASFLKLSTAVAQTKNFKLQNFINASITEVSHNSKTGAVSEEVYQKPKIEVARLEFRYLRVGQESTSNREIFYNVTACLRHGLDQKTTRSHTFKVTKFRQSESEPAVTTDLKTDNNSCLVWDEKITFKYFDCQHYIKGFVKIENAELGLQEKMDIMVNPWESQGILARDMRYVDANEKLILSCQTENRPRTLLMTESFSYSTVSLNYEVDSLLNLHVAKKIQLKMDPRVLIYSSLANGRAEYERLRDGIYLVKLAVVQNRDYDASNTYVASTERLVNVLGGQINADFTFKTQDLKAFGNRNTLLVEIYPADESKLVVNHNGISLKEPTLPLDAAIDTSSTLETPTFMGSITLEIDEATRPLRLVEASAVSQFFIEGTGGNQSSHKFLINQVVAKGLQSQADLQRRQKARADKAIIAQEANLELISLNTIKDADAQTALLKSLGISSSLNKNLQITKADLLDLANRGTLTQAMARKLCAFWGNDYGTKSLAGKKGLFQENQGMKFGFDCYHEVMKDPSQFFLTEKHVLVKDVGGSTFLGGTPFGLSVGTSFSLSAGHTKSVSQSASVSVKAGLSKKFLDLVSIALDGSLQMTWAQSDAKSSSNSISVSTSTSLRVEQYPMQVRVNKYEQCTIVRLNPSLFMKDEKSWIFKKRNYLDHLNSRLNEEEQAAAITRGLMVCEGVNRTNPVTMSETYYAVAQDLGTGRIQDTADARNRKFFLSLRSTKDFNRFVLGMKGKADMPSSDDKEIALQDSSANTVEQLFKAPISSYPGMYFIKTSN